MSWINLRPCSTCPGAGRAGLLREELGKGIGSSTKVAVSATGTTGTTKKGPEQFLCIDVATSGTEASAHT